MALPVGCVSVPTVVRALEKTERLPPDLNGQVPALIAREGLLVTLRPRDLAR
jgi:hypothetical protein